MSLYNLRSSDGEFRITKFDSDLNVESSYLVSHEKCECPQFVNRNQRCRHLRMLRQLEPWCDQPFFYDYETGQWFDSAGGEAIHANEETFASKAPPLLLNPSQHKVASEAGMDMSNTKIIKPIPTKPLRRF